jgi:hypothetical protein
MLLIKRFTFLKIESMICPAREKSILEPTLRRFIRTTRPAVTKYQSLISATNRSIALLQFGTIN